MRHAYHDTTLDLINQSPLDGKDVFVEISVSLSQKPRSRMGFSHSRPNPAHGTCSVCLNSWFHDPMFGGDGQCPGIDACAPGREHPFPFWVASLLQESRCPSTQNVVVSNAFGSHVLL